MSRAPTKGVNNHIAASQTFSQDKHRLLSEARAAPRLMTSTEKQSRRKPSTILLLIESRII
jgi:hypothetical protein